MWTNQVSKMSGAFSHVSGASLTSWQTVNDALTGIHETSKFGTATLHDFGKPDAAFSYGHSPDFFRAEDAKLDPFDRPDGGLRITGVNGRHLSGRWVRSKHKIKIYYPI